MFVDFKSVCKLSKGKHFQERGQAIVIDEAHLVGSWYGNTTTVMLVKRKFILMSNLSKGDLFFNFQAIAGLSLSKELK